MTNLPIRWGDDPRLADVRAALGGSPTKEYLRWCKATATPPVSEYAVRDAARRARMADALRGVLR